MIILCNYSPVCSVWFHLVYSLLPGVPVRVYHALPPCFVLFLFVCPAAHPSQPFVGDRCHHPWLSQNCRLRQIDATIRSSPKPAVHGRSTPLSAAPPSPPSSGKGNLPSAAPSSTPPAAALSSLPSAGKANSPSAALSSPPSAGKANQPYTAPSSTLPSAALSSLPSAALSSPPSVGKANPPSVVPSSPPSAGKANLPYTAPSSTPPSASLSSPPSASLSSPPSASLSSPPSAALSSPPSAGKANPPSVALSSPPSAGKANPPYMAPSSTPPSTALSSPLSTGKANPPSAALSSPWGKPTRCPRLLQVLPSTGKASPDSSCQPPASSKWIQSTHHGQECLTMSPKSWLFLSCCAHRNILIYLVMSVLSTETHLPPWRGSGCWGTLRGPLTPCHAQRKPQLSSLAQFLDFLFLWAALWAAQ